MGCIQRRIGPPNPGSSGMPPAPTNGSNPITSHTTVPNPHPSHGLFYITLLHQQILHILIIDFY